MRQVRDEDKEHLEHALKMVNQNCTLAAAHAIRKVLAHMEDLCQEQPIPAPRIAEATCTTSC